MTTLESPTFDLAYLFPDRETWPDAPVLATENLSVRFGGIAALTDVTTAVHHGEVVAVIGPNGAGKTTYLNASSGLLRGYATGNVWFLGDPINAMPAATIARRGLGRSFQHPPLLPGESVLSNVLIGSHRRMTYGRIGQIFRPSLTKRVERHEVDNARRLLKTVGLGDVADRPAGELSFGRTKLVDITRAVFSRPELLMLDEPTSGLDSDEQEVVVTMLQSLRATRGVTIVLIEHHMEIVRRTASKVIGLEAGNVLEMGSPEHVLNAPAFLEAMVGASHDGRGDMGEVHEEGHK